MRNETGNTKRKLRQQAKILSQKKNARICRDEKSKTIRLEQTVKHEEINQKALVKERRLKRYLIMINNTDAKEHTKMLPASRARRYKDIVTTECERQNNFGAIYGNVEVITEKPKR